MTAQKILNLIENVDPNDSAALDEIDAKTHMFWMDCQDYPAPSWPSMGKPKYTRSRDALKSIRPDGWAFEISALQDAYVCHLNSTNISFRFDIDSAELTTEELAELHAIIQAIAHERGE
jgi:hypothetical protein